MSQQATNQMPRTMLRDLLWSFDEPAPASLPLFIEALQRYALAVRQPFDGKQLQARLPANAVDVRYEYSFEEPSGQWKDATATVRVRAASPLSYAEILYQVHTDAAPRLQGNDHCYFEGFELSDQRLEAGVALYEMFLGS